MAEVKLKGDPIKTVGNLPAVGSTAKNFTLVKSDLSDITLNEFKGKNVILNIFPSLDTSTCALSVKRFNKEASSLKNTVVLCISADLPFAAGRFCTTEGLKNVHTASVFRNSDFAVDYGVGFVTGPLTGLLARAVVIVNPEGKVIYNQLVNEVTEEPDYEAALKAL